MSQSMTSQSLNSTRERYNRSMQCGIRRVNLWFSQHHPWQKGC